MKYIIYLFLPLSILFPSCDETDSQSINIESNLYFENDSENIHLLSEGLNLGSKSKNSSKSINGVNYSFKAIPALTYLKKIGKSIENDDLISLQKELVLLLEFNISKGDIFESERIRLTQNKAVQYLCGPVSENLFLFQDGKKISANGAQYEGSIGTKSTIRTLLYFSDIDFTKPISLKYNDQLFDAGLININLNLNNLEV